MSCQAVQVCSSGEQSGRRWKFQCLSIEIILKVIVQDWITQRKWVQREQEGPDWKHHRL